MLLHESRNDLTPFSLWPQIAPLFSYSCARLFPQTLSFHTLPQNTREYLSPLCFSCLHNLANCLSKSLFFINFPTPLQQLFSFHTLPNAPGSVGPGFPKIPHHSTSPFPRASKPLKIPSYESCVRHFCSTRNSSVAIRIVCHHRSGPNGGKHRLSSHRRARRTRQDQSRAVRTPHRHHLPRSRR